MKTIKGDFIYANKSTHGGRIYTTQENGKMKEERFTKLYETINSIIEPVESTDKPDLEENGD